MTNADIEALERDVERARGRLVTDLARLRSAGGNFSDLKRDVSAEVGETKNRLAASAKDAVRQRTQTLMDAVTARIAANPGAALAIAAGLAWRLYRHPPIASLLVGAGLVQLFRTDPQHPAVGAGMAARAVDMAGSARERLADWRPADTAGQIGEMAASAREQASSLAASAGRQVTDLAAAAREEAGELAETARQRLTEWRAETGEAAGQFATQTGAWTRSRARAASRALEEDRDKYLLGAAGLAIAAAIGIAYQRRLH